MRTEPDLIEATVSRREAAVWGLVLLVLGVICLLWEGVCLQDAFTSGRRSAWILVILTGLLTLLTLSAALRLLLNRPRGDGGLFPRVVLYAGGLGLIGLPVTSLITGKWRELPHGFWQLLFQGTLYVAGGVGCFVLARRRAIKSGKLE